MASQKTRSVNISRLSPARKRAAWEWIQKHRPAQAELIQSADVQELISTFDAEIVIEMEVENAKN